MLSKQLRAQPLQQGSTDIGAHLKLDDIDDFSGEQVVQLYELYKETKGDAAPFA